VALGDARDLDVAVARWQDAVSGDSISEASYRRAGEGVRRLAWDPLAANLRGAERVFVVPDGVLNLVSFQALPAKSQGYLVESGPTIHYLSAERDLVQIDEPGAGGVGLIAFGDPAFDAQPGSPAAVGAFAGLASQSAVTGNYRGSRSGCGDFRTHSFAPLPETAREVDEVCGLWAPSAAGDSAHDFLGGAATEAAFKARAKGHRVVHVATHGFFLGGQCRSALDRRGVGGIAALEPPPAEVGENPLLLSGLALAGANRREEAGPNEEDGIATAEEIAALDLTGTEWAVLSACETGVGEVRAGEGVFGLRRAFQVAGARTLIMSLWSVEDEATREWMRALYEARLRDRRDTAESVRAASLRVLRDRRARGGSTHPFYWGAFVAAGDWH
jgi:CHAT domain-containing protein